MLTMIAISIITFILVTREIFVPTLNYIAWKDAREFEDELRAHKLRVVWSFYPFLRKYNYDEINQRFGMDRVYETVGRAYLKSRAPLYGTYRE